MDKKERTWASKVNLNIPEIFDLSLGKSKHLSKVSLSNFCLSTSTRLSSRFMKAATAARTFVRNCQYLTFGEGADDVCCYVHCAYDLYPVMLIGNLQVNPRIVTFRRFPASVDISRFRFLICRNLRYSEPSFIKSSHILTWQTPQFPVLEGQPEVNLYEKKYW